LLPRSFAAITNSSGHVVSTGAPDSIVPCSVFGLDPDSIWSVDQDPEIGIQVRILIQEGKIEQQKYKKNRKRIFYFYFFSFGG
jgi:hypothetical protein